MDLRWWLLSPLHLWNCLPKQFHRGFNMGLSCRLDEFGWTAVKGMSGFQLLFYLALQLAILLL